MGEPSWAQRARHYKATNIRFASETSRDGDHPSSLCEFEDAEAGEKAQCRGAQECVNNNLVSWGHRVVPYAGERFVEQARRRYKAYRRCGPNRLNAESDLNEGLRVGKAH